MATVGPLLLWTEKQACVIKSENSHAAAFYKKEVEMIKFISYDGAWPNLCRGTLVVEKDGKQYSMYGVLISGGNVSFDADWEANVEEGDWSIDRNALAPELQDDWRELESLVNDEIPHGCCGGCI